MSKHTPGPWLPSKFGFQVVTGDSWSTICELKNPAGWEDGRGTHEQEYKWQNQEANARLIAAAPEMLEALLNVREMISDAALNGFNYKNGNWVEKLFASQQVTSAAIKKATLSVASDVGGRDA